MSTNGQAIVALSFALVALAARPGVAQDETWQLAQVNGSALPAQIEQDDDGCRDEVVSGTLTLRGNGTWVLETSEREVCGDRVENDSEREQGNYARDGASIRFMDEDGDAEDADGSNADDDIDVEDLVRGTVASSTLTVELDDGNTLTFRR